MRFTRNAIVNHRRLLFTMDFLSFIVYTVPGLMSKQECIILHLAISENEPPPALYVQGLNTVFINTFLSCNSKSCCSADTSFCKATASFHLICSVIQ